MAISAHKLIQRRAESLFPYLDNDLFDFLMRYPPKKKAQGRSREDSLAASFPQCADLPRTGTKPKADKRDKEVIEHMAMIRRFQRSNVWKHAVKNSWLFHKPAMLPRIAKDITKMLLHQDAVLVAFTTINLVFYEWMEKYFWHGCSSYRTAENR